MPELPEVETTRKGIAPWLVHQTIHSVIVRDRRLRWPVPDKIEARLCGQTILAIRRRGKYLLFDTAVGTALLHLGMSGSVRIVDTAEPATRHDHLDLCLASGKAMRFRDPRRFGCFLWTQNPCSHALLRNLGPEPLSESFDGDYLRGKAQGRSLAIKQFIMNPAIVVGIGNIYANESLFAAGIHPKRRCSFISKSRMQSLASAVKSVLCQAIQAGGTTLRDFRGSDGKPGYFQTRLDVYGRGGKPCKNCGAPLTVVILGQRSTYYCKICQK